MCVGGHKYAIARIWMSEIYLRSPSSLSILIKKASLVV